MKKCKNCGKEFKSGYRGRKYFCSGLCGSKYWQKQHKGKKHTKCIVCGKPLTNGGYSYCSESCRKIQAKKRKLEKVIHTDVTDNFDVSTIDICLNCTEDDCIGECERIKKYLR